MDKLSSSKMEDSNAEASEEDENIEKGQNA
jgi:hypothetical protein